jgi:DNA invertase Pin-like site-specific DNA recombinase
LCGDHDYQVSITPYKDLGFSGMDRNRPALNRLLRDIEDDKIEIIIVQSLSDLTRCNAHLAELWQFFQRYGIMVLITHMMPVEVAA